MTPTNLPMNFPAQVLKLWTVRSNPLDSMSADEIKRRMKLGADTRSHFEALTRANRAKQLNKLLEN